MKPLTIILCSFWLLLAGCKSKKELTREEAFRLLQESKTYPKVIDYDLYVSDPQEAKKVIDAGLETQGLVTVQRTQKLADAGKPLIAFTTKAQPALLPTPEKDKASHIQKTKLADEVLVEVTALSNASDGQRVEAEYTTSYKNVSGFAPLTNIDFQKTKAHKTTFVLSDKGWQLGKIASD